jgi:transposase InsO family protein
VSDCNTRFTSRFWQELTKHLGIKQSMSTAFHPHTDGRTERVNEVLEVIDGEKFWVVKSIAKSVLNRKAKRVEYLVFWQGYPPEEASSEPWEHLEGDEAVETLVKESHRRYPKQVKDPRVKL